ncbi:MAG: ACT domain-containing protein [Limnochordia bacterium]
MSRLKLRMTVLDGVYAVCRLDPRSGMPSWATGSFRSITQTGDELSVVCPQECVPSGVLHEGGWRIIKVIGPLDFALIGLMASISRALAEAGISIFALSTYDTDYVLVKAVQLERAVEALTSRGVEFV